MYFPHLFDRELIIKVKLFTSRVISSLKALRAPTCSLIMWAQQQQLSLILAPADIPPSEALAPRPRSRCD